MPSSVKLGTRPMRVRMRAYSSALRPWAAARRLLGLLLNPKVKVEPAAYSLYYRDKLGSLLKKAQDPEFLLDNYLPNGWSQPKLKNPLELYDHLIVESEELSNHPHNLSQYLKNQMSLKEVKEAYGLKDDQKEPVSDQQFLKELKNLSLEEYLEEALLLG